MSKTSQTAERTQPWFLKSREKLQASKLCSRKCSSDFPLWDVEYLERQEVLNAKLKKASLQKHIPSEATVPCKSLPF